MVPKIQRKILFLFLFQLTEPIYAKKKKIREPLH